MYDIAQKNLIQISLKCVPKGPINNDGLVQYKQQAIIGTNAALVYWYVHASFSLKELTDHEFLVISYGEVFTVWFLLYLVIWQSLLCWVLV